MVPQTWKPQNGPAEYETWNFIKDFLLGMKLERNVFSAGQLRSGQIVNRTIFRLQVLTQLARVQN